MTVWPRRSLADLCAQTDRQNPGEDPEAHFRYVDIGSIDRTAKRIAKFRVIAGANAPSRARQVIRTGDVLVSTVRPNLNAVAMVPAELDRAIASTGFCVLRAKKDLVDPRYIFFQTRSPAFIEALTATARGASYPAVSEVDVKNQSIPVPPPAEQRRIIDVLDQTDRLRCLRAETDAKADRLLPALFLRKFGDPGTNPMGWKERRIGDLCNVVSGATPKTNRDEYWGGNVAWATPKDLSRLDDWTLDRTERTLTDDGFASCSATMLPEGSVLLSSRAPIGLVAISGIPVCTNQGFKSLVCGPEVDPWYLFAWCKLRTSFLQSLGHGATFKELSKRTMSTVQLPVPPMSAQAGFRAQMEQLHNTRQQARNASTRTRSLFLQLLGSAFSGSLTADQREAKTKEALPTAAEQQTDSEKRPGLRLRKPEALALRGVPSLLSAELQMAQARRAWQRSDLASLRSIEHAPLSWRHLRAGFEAARALQETTRSFASVNYAARRLATEFFNDEVRKLTAVADLARTHSSWTRNIQASGDFRDQIAVNARLALESSFRLTSFAQQACAGLDADRILDKYKTHADFASRSLASFDALASKFAHLTHAAESLPTLTALPAFVLPGASRELAVTGHALLTLAPEEDEAENEEADSLAELRSETASVGSLLSQADPALAVTYEGAKEALAGSSVDRGRHVLVSLRELWSHLLRTLAPDEEVGPWLSSKSSDLSHEGRPTRRARLLYVCRELDHEPLSDFVESDAKAFVRFMELLNRVHQLEPGLSDQQLRALVLWTESSLLFLLQIAHEGRRC